MNLLVNRARRRFVSQLRSQQSRSGGSSVGKTKLTLVKWSSLGDGKSKEHPF